MINYKKGVTDYTKGMSKRDLMDGLVKYKLQFSKLDIFKMNFLSRDAVAKKFNDNQDLYIGSYGRCQS